MTYVFADDQIRSYKNAKRANPETIGRALNDILGRNGGNLKPKAVVEAARAPTHPLHRHFEWNDSIAGEKYRLEQARMLIRSVRYEDESVPATIESPARAFLSIQERKGISYRSLSDVLGSADLQRRVLDHALRDMLAFEQRYRHLDQLCDLIRQMREVRQSLSGESAASGSNHESRVGA